MEDIVIIGAGVIGSSIARELSAFEAKIVVLEKGNDVSVGTSKANSGIVHAGYDAKPGTLKAYYNVLGNSMFDKLSKELDFPFVRNGSIVLCFDEREIGGLNELMERAKLNGVSNVRIESGDEIRKLEPFVSEKVVAGLVADTGGIVSPYEMTIAYAENASVNGVDFRFNCKVTDIRKNDDVFEIKTESGDVILSRAVINCAGVYSDVVNNMVCENKLKIVPRKGDYELLDKSTGYLAHHTLFQLPTKMGKGILVTPTVHGNILVGPTATDVSDRENTMTTAEELGTAFEKGKITVPTLSERDIITQFSGIRAHLDGGDFVIGESEVENFFNCAGIESPGLTCAPAIAVDVSKMVAEKLGLAKKENFVRERKGIPHIAMLSEDEVAKLIDKNPLYGKIVCRCEVVSEGEIVDAINRPVGARDLDGVKRRTRTGMGRCQAGFCTSTVMDILVRELNVDFEDVTKNGKGSEIIIKH